MHVDGHFAKETRRIARGSGRRDAHGHAIAHAPERWRAKRNYTRARVFMREGMRAHTRTDIRAVVCSLFNLIYIYIYSEQPTAIEISSVRYAKPLPRPLAIALSVLFLPRYSASLSLGWHYRS